MAVQDARCKSSDHDIALTKHQPDRPNARNNAQVETVKVRIDPMHLTMGSIWDARAVQYHSPAEVQQPFVTRGRLDILRPRNGESVTLWVAKHVRGQGRGASTDFPKRR